MLTLPKAKTKKDIKPKTNTDMKDKPYVIGLDLGGTNSVFGIVDKDAKIVSTVSVPTAGHGSADAYVKNCTAAIMPLIEEVGGITKIKAMGIGAPNANYYSGCIEDAPNLEWRGNTPLVKMFQESLGIPVVMTNDANAAAIGEMTYGAARGMKNFIEITLGTGVGSGIVVNGQLIYGSDGFAGELGHVIVEKNGRDCGCGRKGCLECYCSGTGIARSALEKLANSRKPSVLREKLSSKLEAKDVHLSAQDGDELALEILADTGRRLGEACANFATFCSPEAFIFFGGPTRAGELLMSHIRNAYDENVLFVYRGKAKILLSELDGASAAVLGASALGWEA